MDRRAMRGVPERSPRQRRRERNVMRRKRKYIGKLLSLCSKLLEHAKENEPSCLSPTWGSRATYP